MPQERHAKPDDIYVLNPFYRLRNEQGYVKVFGYNGTGAMRLHHTFAIVAILCDGNRTLLDIARETAPFVPDSATDDILKVSLQYVLCAVDLLLREPEQGSFGLQSVPSDAVLVQKSMMSQFPPVPAPRYDPRQFLPGKAHKPSRHPEYQESAPSSVTWHLTDTCLADCRYCYLPRRRLRASDHLSRDRVLEIVDECHELGVAQITPAGGDVLVYPHLFDFLDALTKYTFMPFILSTKAKVDKNLAKRLADYRSILELQFSVDSCDEAIASYLVRVPDFYRKTLESIENALEAGLRVTAKSVITPYNIFTIPQLYRELRHRGVTEVRLTPYCRTISTHRDEFFNHTESFEWLEKQVEELRKEFPADIINLQNGPPVLQPSSPERKAERWKERSPCSAGRSSIMICADGKTIACEQTPEIEETFLGDLKVQNLHEIWNSDILYDKLLFLDKKKFTDTLCGSCDEFEECLTNKGFCIRDEYRLHGKVDMPPYDCPKSEIPFVRSF